RRRPRERRISAVSRVYGEHGPGAHGIFLHLAWIGVLGDEIRNLGRRTQRVGGDRRAVHSDRRAVDARSVAEHREHVRRDAAEMTDIPDFKCNHEDTKTRPASSASSRWLGGSVTNLLRVFVTSWLNNARYVA